MSEELQANGAETLRDKVDAAKSRLAERTAGSKSVQTVKGLIEEHPVASVAAGILLGALVAKALPRSAAAEARQRLQPAMRPIRCARARAALLQSQASLPSTMRCALAMPVAMA